MIHPLLAEMNGLEVGGLICSIIFGALSLVIATTALFKKSDTVISPNPLPVEVVKALHEQFANRDHFEKHLSQNTQRHAQLFAQIDELARETRIEMDKRFSELNDERRRTLEKLNEQYVFIRENISAINRELQLRGKP